MLIGKNELGGECSDVDDSGQLLDSVEEDVAVLDDRLVLRVLRVGAVGDDDPAGLSGKVEENFNFRKWKNNGKWGKR